MRARAVLQKCLQQCLSAMHAALAEVLLKAVDALVAGRRLTLMDLARSWPDAVKWLIPQPQPVLIVDGSDATHDQGWQLLRAAVPVGDGR